MEPLLDILPRNLLDPKTLIGATIWAVVFLAVASVLAAAVRGFTRRLEPRLSDVTALRFAGAFVRVLIYLLALILYAQLVPGLRAMGAALLAGVSIISIVIGLAAQNTLSNLVAGLSLVLYRPIRVGDTIQLNSPKGLMTATVEVVSLGYTRLRDPDGHQVIVPNSVMMSSVVIRLTGLEPDE